MNTNKQILLIAALAACMAPTHATERSTTSSALSPEATIAACALIAGGAAAYCIYEWYTTDRYWSIRGITREVEHKLHTHIPTLRGPLVWDRVLHKNIPSHRNLEREHGDIELSVEHVNGKWVVKVVTVTIAACATDLTSPGKLTVKATYAMTPGAPATRQSFVSQRK